MNKSASNTGSLQDAEIKQNQEQCAENLNDLPFRIKVTKTICMMSLYIGLGLWSGVISPSTVDIVEMYHCTYEHFVRATTMKAIGAMCGSFLGAMVADRYSKKADLLLFVVCVIGGLCCIAIPWSPGLIVMAVLFSVTGLSHGTTNIVCSSLCLAMWQKSAAAPLHGLHMCYTIGATIAPLITLPFLSKNTTTTTPNSTYENRMNFDDTPSGSVPYTHHNTTVSHVQIPYAIFGAWSIIVACPFMVFLFKNYVFENVHRRRQINRCKDMLNPGSCAGGSNVFGVLFISFTLIIYILIQGRERGLAAYLFVIANKGALHLPKPQSAWLVTAYNAATAAGRGISGLLSKHIKIHLLLFGQVLIASFLQMLMVFYGLTTVTSLWVLSCLAAMFMGPTLPAFMAWSDHYIDVNGTVVAVIDIGLALGSFMALWTNGHLYELYGTVAVFWVGFILGVTLIFVLIVFQIIVCIKGGKTDVLELKKSINDETDDENSPLIQK